MEFLLNEKSLCGQFDNVNSFLLTLNPVIKCIELLHVNDIPIYKTVNFYESKITSNDRLCDLKKYELTEELLRLKLSLDREIYEKPQWDYDPVHDISQEFMWNDENVSATSLAETAIRKGVLLSFCFEVFKDKMLNICDTRNTYYVDSVHTPLYLVEQYRKQIKIERKLQLKIKYENTRIDCSTLEEKYGVDTLEQYEFEEVIKSFNKFVEHESWKTIDVDDGLEYKKYTPQGNKNWFIGRKYSGKTIMKFRCSSKMRCFGYRKDDKFKVLRIERDHTRSNYG